MDERTVKISDKYEVVIDLSNGVFKALRYGTDWRNLVGDNLILSMVQEIEDLRERLEGPTGDNGKKL